LGDRQPIPKPRLKSKAKNQYTKKKFKKKRVATPEPEGDHVCAECDEEKYLSIHHVFGNSNRNNSSTFKCVEWLCWKHHQSSTGIHGTHSDGKLDKKLKKKHQLRLIESGMTTEEFLRIFGRNYL